jgi:predicted protein tyrosine phosphatase
MCWHDHDLYLNLISPPTPLFQPQSFKHFFSFAYANAVLRQHRLLIHCDWGESRAPSLVLLYLAKLVCELPDDSYAATYQSTS